MATVHLTVGWLTARDFAGGTLPVEPGNPPVAATITSTGSSARTTFAAGDTIGSERVATVVAKGGDVWIAFGAAAVAGTGGGHLVTAGVPRTFSLANDITAIAVKDA